MEKVSRAFKNGIFFAGEMILLNWTRRKSITTSFILMTRVIIFWKSVLMKPLWTIYLFGKEKNKRDLTAESIANSEPFYGLNQRAKAYFTRRRNPYRNVSNSNRLFIIYGKNYLLYISVFLLLISLSLIGFLR